MGLRPTQGDEKRLGPATALHGSVALPFDSHSLLWHPERTRISCHAAPDTVACAPFSKERRMKFANATKFYRKSGVAEGSAVPSTSIEYSPITSIAVWNRLDTCFMPQSRINLC
jgi:hypothetical protein